VVGIDALRETYSREQKLANLANALDYDTFEFLEADLLDADLRSILDGVEAVIHLAARPGVRESWGKDFHPYVTENVIATARLLDALASTPGKRLIFASSSSVYGEARTQPTAEHEPLRPYSPYGVTKVTAEQLCDVYGANFGVSTIILRYFTVFGPRQRPDMSLYRFCEAALTGGEVAVFGDGNQVRDFTFVSDAAAATLAAVNLSEQQSRHFNVGGGSPATVNEAIAALEEIFERPLRRRHVEIQKGDVQATFADTTRARRELNYTPLVTFVDGLRAEYEWLRETMSPNAQPRRGSGDY
jgi:UDP-glucuronate 4-epimerase